jgi:hydroxymethylpyrimidine pyrophosphatase-like HAD family hydrolase
LADAGFGWCQLVDNGLIRQLGMHAYHVAPAGTGKRAGVRIDRDRHGIDRSDATYIGDGAADVDCAAEVAACWLVANAEAGLEWPHRTDAPYGAGVAELIDRLLAG